MAVCCLFGVCIPYSVLWPVILLILKPIFEYFGFSWNTKKKTETPSIDCCAKDTSKIADTLSRVGRFDMSSDDNWKSLISSNRPTFVKFTATWCGPCKASEPYWESVSAEYPELSFVTVDVDEFDEIAAEHKAFGIPLFLSFHNGNEIGRLTGAKSYDVLKKFTDDIVQSTPK